MAEKTKKKGILSKLAGKMNKKLDEEAEKGCSCCCGCDAQSAEKSDKKKGCCG